jgi:NADPH-dependent 2,4-dienoyl-CoA reductase/sulfur reductase-like enzyme
MADFRRLWADAASGKRFAVIGGGFIGAEIAAALAMNGAQVTMLFRQPTIGAQVFPADIGRFLNDYYREKGVDVRPGVDVSAVESDMNQVRLRYAEGEVVADGVVAGIGIVPNVELAESAGLAEDNGIVVDEYLRTTAPGVFAAGDVAAFYNPALDKRVRVEHEDNALTMGEIAGRNMAGAEVKYTHLPYFYSDLFDVGYEAVGDIDARLDVLSDWVEPYQKGVLYYHTGGAVRGVLLWNVWDKVDEARKLIESRAEPAFGAIAMER